MQALYIVLWHETSKFRSKICSVSSQWYALALRVSCERNVGFAKYHTCASCTRRCKTPTPTLTDRGVPAHVCKYHCNISRDEQRKCLDYHLVVRLKNPKLLRERFIEYYDEDIRRLYRLWTRFNLSDRVNYACFSGNLRPVEPILSPYARYKNLLPDFNHVYMRIYKLVEIACSCEDTTMISAIIDSGYIITNTVFDITNNVREYLTTHQYTVRQIWTVRTVHNQYMIRHIMYPR